MSNSSNYGKWGKSIKYLENIESSDIICSSNLYNYEEGKQEVTIPKIIFQTWKTKDVPDKWSVSPKSIKKHMPDWEYVLMSDKENREFVKKYFPDFLSYYDNFEYNIQRADAIRYMWLYINGGLYMDLDFKVLHPLDELFTNNSDAYLVSSGNVGSYITNSFMASKPKCRLWLEMIEAMKHPNLPWYYMGKHIQVMNTTGPIMLTHVAKKSTVIYSMLPGKLIMPCNVCNIMCKADNSFLQPLEGSSWISYDTKFYNFFLCKWKKVLLYVGFLIVLLLIVLFVLWMDIL